MSRIFTINNFRSCVPGWHQHWGWHYWVEFCQLPPSPWALERPGALALVSPSPVGRRGFHECLSLHSSTATWAGGRDRSSPVPSRCLGEHRSSQQRGLGASAVGQLCKGWGTAATTKLWVLSPHTHTEIVHSNQCGRKCLQDLSWELLIINNSWTARRASAVTLSGQTPRVLSMTALSEVRSSSSAMVLVTYVSQDISLLHSPAMAKSHTHTCCHQDWLG